MNKQWKLGNGVQYSSWKIMCPHFTRNRTTWHTKHLDAACSDMTGILQFVFTLVGPILWDTFFSCYTHTHTRRLMSLAPDTGSTHITETWERVQWLPSNSQGLFILMLNIIWHHCWHMSSSVWYARLFKSLKLRYFNTQTLQGMLWETGNNKYTKLLAMSYAHNYLIRHTGIILFAIHFINIKTH